MINTKTPSTNIWLRELSAGTTEPHYSSKKCNVPLSRVCLKNLPAFRAIVKDCYHRKGILSAFAFCSQAIGASGHHTPIDLKTILKVDTL